MPTRLTRKLVAGLATAPAALALSAALFAAPAVATFEDAHLNPDHVGADNPGFKTGQCPDGPEGFKYVWDFVFPDGETVFKTITITFEKAGPVTLSFPDEGAKHAYVFTSGPDSIVSGIAGRWGTLDQFDLNGVCAPQQAPPTTVPPTTVPPTTAPPTTQAPKAETPAPVAVAPAVETAPVVQPLVEAPQQLAFTGSHAAERLSLAAALIAMGGAMMAVTHRKRQLTH